MGNLTLLSIPLLLIILSWVTIYLFVSLADIKKMRIRKELYLCSRIYTNITYSYLMRINKLNTAILTAQVLAKSQIPYVAQTASAAVTLSKSAQSIIHALYIKDLVNVSYCETLMAPFFLTHLPYKTIKTIFLQRTFLGTTIIKNTSWNVVIFNIEKNIFKSVQYFLRVHFSVKSNTSTHAISSLKEIDYSFTGIKDFVQRNK